MARVAEKSSHSAIEFALNRAKGHLEDLHLKGAGIKRIIRPSDDPPGNIELMQLRTRTNNFSQYEKNANFSLILSELTEESLNELTDILMKAKEIAIAQASNLYNAAIRKSVAEEVDQLGKQILGISNRQVGNRYIFGGHKNESRPFSADGIYKGDSGVVYLEIAKDFYVPTNIPGDEVFFYKTKLKELDYNPLKNIDQDSDLSDSTQFAKNDEKSQISGSLFGQIKILVNALRSNDNIIIQDLLERIDDSIDRIITLRTKIGSNVNTIRSTIDMIENNKISLTARKSAIEDADVAELFTDITKQDNILKAVYKTGSHILNQNLLDFLR